MHASDRAMDRAKWLTVAVHCVLLLSRFDKMATPAAPADSSMNMEEPPYKKNLERLAALQDRLSKVQKTAESLLATVSGSGGDYTDKLVYTDVGRVTKYLETNKVNSAALPSTGVASCDRAASAARASCTVDCVRGHPLISCLSIWIWRWTEKPPVKCCKHPCVVFLEATGWGRLRGELSCGEFLGGNPLPSATACTCWAFSSRTRRAH
jgi:hypothetical protein